LRVLFHIVALIYLLQAAYCQIPEEINLYPQISGNSISSEIKILDKDGNLDYISGKVRPRLIVYEPEGHSECGIIYCPGGGYGRLNIKSGRDLSTTLNDWGITVFVLVYTLPGIDSVFASSSEFQALKDLNKAYSLIKSNKKWEEMIIGYWGASAGGHLAAMGANDIINFADVQSYSPPDFLVLVSPIISFEMALNPKIYYQLTGKNISDQLDDFFSAEKRVSSHNPKTFILHSDDDKISYPVNSIRYYMALSEYNVNAEMHLYESGGHGFYISEDSNQNWVRELNFWIVNNGFIKQSLLINYSK